MKLEIQEHCFGEALFIDNEKVDNITDEQCDIIIDKLSKTMNRELIVRELIKYFGVYGDSEKCDQCGDYACNITLEL